MNPYTPETHIAHAFDTYCKRVIRNEARDYFDEVARLQAREVFFSELSQRERAQLEQQEAVDDYPFEAHRFIVQGYDVAIRRPVLLGSVGMTSLT